MISTIYTILKDALFYITPRTNVTWHVEIKDKKHLTVINTSKKTAYNVQIEDENNLFWSFSYKEQSICGGSKLTIGFTRITAAPNSGFINIKWTDSSGKKKANRRYQLNF